MMSDAKLKWRRYEGGELPAGKYLVGVLADDGTVAISRLVPASFVNVGMYIVGPLEVEQPLSEPIDVVGADGPPCVNGHRGGTLVATEANKDHNRIVLLAVTSTMAVRAEKMLKRESFRRGTILTTPKGVENVFSRAPCGDVVRMFNAAAEEPTDG